MVSREGKVSVWGSVLGQNYPDSPNQTYLTAANNLFGGDMTLERLYDIQDGIDELAEEFDFNKLPLGVREIWFALNGINHVISGDYLRPSDSSLLSNWPIYQQLMEQPDSGASKTEGVALMVGSQSALTSHAFRNLSEELYGTDKSVVVDIASGWEKAHTGQFVFANGFRLPFPDKAISIIHTGHLISGLVDSTRPFEQFPESVFELVKEFARVLPVGGQMFMHENFPDIDAELAQEDMSFMLNIAHQVLKVVLVTNGFRATFEQAEIPKSTDYWHDPLRRIPKSKHERLCLNTLAIYARKMKNVPEAKLIWAE